MVHGCNPSSSEVETGRPGTQGQLQLHSKFKASLGYLVRHRIKKKEREKGGERKGEREEER